jgi:hypothetical protein
MRPITAMLLPTSTTTTACSEYYLRVVHQKMGLLSESPIKKVESTFRGFLSKKVDLPKTRPATTCYYKFQINCFFQRSKRDFQHQSFT